MADMFRPTRTSHLEMDVAGLEDVALSEPTPQEEQLRGRPECLKSIVHEIAFVVACTFAGASFAFLQRSTVILTGSVSQELGMNPSQESWISAASGYASTCV